MGGRSAPFLNFRLLCHEVLRAPMRRDVFKLHRSLVATRPGGGVIGGVPSLGGATEHQGYGTPHLHVNVHVASTYQFDTLAETVRKLKEQKFSIDDWFAYHEWFHAEEVLDKGVREELAPGLEEDWFARFSDRKHDDMSVTPLYLASDVQEEKLKADISAVKDQDGYASLREDGAAFKRQYLADAQRMFSRVQHHMHKRTKRVWCHCRPAGVEERRTA